MENRARELISVPHFEECADHVLAAVELERNVEVDCISSCGRGTNQLPVVRCGVPGAAGGVANTARGTAERM